MAGSAGPKPEHIGWYKIYEWDDFTRGITYLVDNSSTAPSFTRVLHILKMDEYSVFAEYDDWTGNTATKLAIPSNSTIAYETDVTNLTVRYKIHSFPGANSSTIEDCTNVNGRIEMWYGNYGTSGGDSNVYDYNDAPSLSSSYGCYQVFRTDTTPPRTIFAWNDHSDSNFDIGMGNRNTSHPDWTFAGGVSSYSNNPMQVLVK